VRGALPAGLTGTPATSIADAVALMVFHRINCLLVSDGGAQGGASRR